MTMKLSEVAAPAAPRCKGRFDERTERVLLLDPVAASGFEVPIVLDQKATHLCFSSAGELPAGKVVIERSELGWRLLSADEGCRLNGAPASEAWLHDGDQVMISNTEFRVRPATTDELLDYLPQTDGESPSNGATAAAAGDSAVSDRALDVAARERDLADWERCLAECESDLRTREATLKHSAKNGSLDDCPAGSLDGLRTDRTAFDAGCERIEEWLEELKDQRAILESERRRLADDRAALAGRMKISDPGPSPAEAETAIMTPTLSVPATDSLAGRIAAGFAGGGEPSSPRRRSPRRTPGETRARLNSLRDVANQSARQALSRHFWERHRSAVLLKAALVFMSFALAGVLYSNHGMLGSPASAFAWGAMAIGLITTSGLVHTWSEINRLAAGNRAEGVNDDHPSTDATCPSRRS